MTQFDLIIVDDIVSQEDSRTQSTRDQMVKFAIDVGLIKKDEYRCTCGFCGKYHSAIVEGSDSGLYGEEEVDFVSNG